VWPTVLAERTGGRAGRAILLREARPPGGGPRSSEGLGRMLGEATELTVRTGDDHDVAVRFSKPELQVVCERVDVQGFEHVRLSLDGALEVCFHLLRREPESDTVSVGRERRIAEMRVFVSVPAVQLQDENSVEHQLLVLRTWSLAAKAACRWRSARAKG
jgi:hypothetical protein